MSSQCAAMWHAEVGAPWIMESVAGGSQHADSNLQYPEHERSASV